MGKFGWGTTHVSSHLLQPQGQLRVGFRLWARQRCAQDTNIMSPWWYGRLKSGREQQVSYGHVRTLESGFCSEVLVAGLRAHLLGAPADGRSQGPCSYAHLLLLLDLPVHLLLVQVAQHAQRLRIVERAGVAAAAQQGWDQQQLYFTHPRTAPRYTRRFTLKARCALLRP